MDKIITGVLWHLRAMWRYRGLGLFTAWAVAMGSAMLVFSIPKKYEASARLFVNTDSILKPLMEGVTVPPDNGQRVAMLSRLMISRPNVTQLIDEVGLDVRHMSAEQRERLIDEVGDVLAIEAAGEKSNTYILRYRDTQPQRAKRMVELLVTKFIDSSKGGRATDNDAARRFLDQQANAYEEKLQEADARLREFKAQHMAGAGAVTEEGSGYQVQLAAVKEQLGAAELQLREAENSRDAYRRSLALENGAAAAAAGGGRAGVAAADLDARIEAGQLALDGLLQKYTERHPDVGDARRALAGLKEQRRQLPPADPARPRPLARAQAAAGDARAAADPLRVALAQADAAVASLQTRVAQYAARHQALLELGRRMPEYEVHLAQLNRDYQINKKNYDELAKRRESASIAGDMQSVAGVGDFRLIDPPRVAPASSTSRLLALAAGLVGALLAGLGAMFLAKELRARFYDRSQVAELTGLRVLGVISVVPSAAATDEQQLRLARFALTGAVLFAVYIGVVIAGALLSRSQA
ncbi:MULTISPECIES: XrtA system polysaccharide chain length determinant [unclassified Janthinobacterium]|uniref:XrtA system polysaccharide chain length determinant n=1 Tax=unclassified Janthinobacterium TaxID=2610881 RepID=UPI00056122E3|nr:MULTISPECIES: XrtA system polysaccharide chain length determinant [unclassified Janthinobacterium]MEC5161191.1 polysaccharide chain length determinant protein (PEP-CTERM system associated) [Janthinobacterium sp. CG_S6]